LAKNGDGEGSPLADEGVEKKIPGRCTGGAWSFWVGGAKDVAETINDEEVEEDEVAFPLLFGC